MDRGRMECRGVSDGNRKLQWEELVVVCGVEGVFMIPIISRTWFVNVETK